MVDLLGPSAEGPSAADAWEDDDMPVDSDFRYAMRDTSYLHGYVQP